MRKCAVCGSSFERYAGLDPVYIENPKKYGRKIKVKSELLNPEEYSCPVCYSADRDRMIVLFIKKLREAFGTTAPSVKFLEVAPSAALKRYLYKEWGESFLYTADLYMDNVDFKVDIQNMEEIPDQTFDFIVCSHVLEHVKDDQKAMGELNRVLKDAGLGILLVPINLFQEQTDEEWGLSEEENWRRFGQGDHVRAYNKLDYVARLEANGFCVLELNKNYFDKDDYEANAFNDTATLYLVHKNPDIYSSLEEIADKFKETHLNDTYLYKNVEEGVCNYWIDLCRHENDQLQIWGWAYFREHDSRKTKLKLHLAGRSIQRTFAFDLRYRQDVCQLFGESYGFSGIDILKDVSISDMEGGKVSLRLYNEGSCYTIPLSVERIEENEPDCNIDLL